MLAFVATLMMCANILYTAAQTRVQYMSGSLDAFNSSRYNPIFPMYQRNYLYEPPNLTYALSMEKQNIYSQCVFSTPVALDIIEFIGNASFTVQWLNSAQLTNYLNRSSNSYRFRASPQNITLGVGYTDFITGCTLNPHFYCGLSMHYQGMCPWAVSAQGCKASDPNNMRQKYSIPDSNRTSFVEFCKCVGTFNYDEYPGTLVMSCSSPKSGNSYIFNYRVIANSLY